jgi:uncharacterized protein (TIGR02611 family)
MAGRLHTPLEWFRVIKTNLWRLIILVVGCVVLLAGVAMLALPGPGILVIIAGLAILAREFTWAEKTLDRTKAQAVKAKDKVVGNGRMKFRRPKA